MFRIGGNTFYDQKNKIPMKVPEFKRSGIGLIVEFSGIPNGFPNQAGKVNPFLDKYRPIALRSWKSLITQCSYSVTNLNY